LLTVQLQQQRAQQQQQQQQQQHLQQSMNTNQPLRHLLLNPQVSAPSFTSQEHNWFATQELYAVVTVVSPCN